MIFYVKSITKELIYQYDQLNRLTKVNLPDGGKVKYKYDKLNRVVEKINSNDTGTNYQYTDRGRVKTIKHWTERGGSRKLLESYGYIYNANGQRKFQIEGSGELEAYQYDEVDRLKKVKYPFRDKKKLADLKERGHFGLLSEVSEPTDYQLDFSHNMTWNKESNLRNQLEEDLDLLDSSSGGEGTLSLDRGENALPFVTELNVSMDQEDKIDSLYDKIDKGGDSSIDPMNSGYWTEEFTYDPSGNVVAKQNGWGQITYAYNQSNQLVQAGERKYSYDANGNLVKEQLGDLSAEYEYNYKNRLVRARNNSNYPHFFNSGRPFKGEVRYKYDALDRKIEKTVDPLRGAWQETQRYMYDGKSHNMIEGYEMRVRRKGNNDRGRGKGHGNAGKMNKISEYYQAEGKMVAMNYFKHPKIGNGWWPKHPNKGLNFYHKDALGSVVMTTGRNGQAVERYEYDAYGKPYNGWFEHSAHNQNPYGFTGQRYSNQLGTWNFAYRHYNSNSMHWMTQDPVRDGTNWYQYVNAAPVNLVDPLGLFTFGIGYSVSGSAGAGAEFSQMVVIDDEGNIGVATTLSGGGAFPDAEVGVTGQITNVDTIHNLVGWGGSVGGGTYASGSLDISSAGAGISSTWGPSASPIEMHGMAGKTWVEQIGSIYSKKGYKKFKETMKKTVKRVPNAKDKVINMIEKAEKVLNVPAEDTKELKQIINRTVADIKDESDSSYNNSSTPNLSLKAL